jgi:hypothetical protein
MARKSFRLRRATGAGDTVGVGSYVRGLPSNQESVGVVTTDEDAALKSSGVILVNATSDASVFEASPFAYNGVTLRWLLTEDFTPVEQVGASQTKLVAVAVVYSTTGYPETVVDGTLLIQGTVTEYNHQTQLVIQTESGSYIKEEPEPGKWAYYTLFAYYNVDGVGGSYFYEKLESLEVLMPYNHGSVERLWKRVPQYYRELDANNSAVDPENLNRGQLQRFLDVFGFEIDKTRSLIDSLMVQYDPLLAEANGVAELANMLGLELNVNDIGVSRTRALLHDIGYIRRQKGTIDATKAYITAVSGSDVTITTGASAPFYTFNVHAQRANLVADPRFLTNSGVSWNVAQQPAVTRTNRITNPNFETDLNNWSSAQTGSVRSTDFAYSGTNSYKVTVNTADSNVAYHSSSSYEVGSVTISLYVYTPVGSTLAGRTISTSIEGGTATSTTTTNNAGTLIAGQWVRVSHIRNVTVAGTMVVVYRLSGTMGTASGQLLYFDAALGESGSSVLPYFDGTYVNDYQGYGILSKGWSGTANASTSTASWFTGNTRTNLVPNPNFETNTTGWGANSTNTLATSTAFAKYGTTSVRSTSVGGANNGIFLNPRYPVTVGDTYTCSGWFYVPTGQAAISGIVRLAWYTALTGGTNVSNSDSTTTSIPAGGGWVRVSVTGTVPATATHVVPILFSNGTVTTGNYFHIDGILFEKQSSLLPYFDGTFSDAYTGFTLNTQAWAGTANASTSTASWYTTNLLPTISTTPTEGIQITAGASGNKIAVVSNVAVPVSANNSYYISADFSSLPQIVYGGSWATSSTWTDWSDNTAAASISVGVDGRYAYEMNPTTSGTKYPAFLLNLSAGQSITLSKWMVEPNSAGQFFDGDTVFSGFLYQGFTSDHTWSGTPYASYSLYTTNRKKTQDALARLMPKILPVTLMGTSGGNAKYLMQFDWIPGKT